MRNKFIQIITFVVAFLLVFMQFTTNTYANQTTTTFSDIKGHYAESVINEWVKNGIITGFTDKTFRPQTDVTRAQFIVLFNKAFKIDNANGVLKTFSDVSKDNWYYDDVMLAANLGIIEGYPNGRFGPEDPITRQDASVILSKYFSLSDVFNPAYINKFLDKAIISDYALKHVTALADLRIISGKPDGNFAPRDNITRADSVIMLNNVYKMVAGESGIIGVVYYDNKELSDAIVTIQKENDYMSKSVVNTNLEGHFTTKLEAGTYNILVSKDNKVAFKSEIVVRNNIKSFVKITLEEGQTVSGILKDTNGNLLANQILYFKTNPYFAAFSDSNGHISTVLPRNREFEMFYTKDGHLVSAGKFSTSGTTGALALGNIITSLGISVNTGSGGRGSSQPMTYSLTIIAGIGGMVTGANGNYISGSSINITASPSEGYEFDHWLSSNGGTFANASSANTTFSMPANNVTVTAIFMALNSKVVIDSMTSLMYILPPNDTTTLKVVAKGEYSDDLLTYQWSTTDGTIVANGNSADFTAPETKKDVTITVLVSDQDGNQAAQSIVITVGDLLTGGDFVTQFGVNDEEDTDGDGLTNGEERSYGTNPYKADTDNDGLTDYDEIQNNTDPLKYDTDDDGLSDGVEIALGTDPLVPDNPSTPLQYTKSLNVDSDNYFKMELFGSRYFANTNIYNEDKSILLTNTGLLGKLYKVDYSNNVASANIEIGYSATELISKGILESELTILAFDNQTRTLSQLSSTKVSGENAYTANITNINAETKHYVLGKRALDAVRLNSASVVLCFDLSSENNPDFAGSKWAEEFSKVSRITNDNVETSIVVASGDNTDVLLDKSKNSEEVKVTITDMERSTINSADILNLINYGAANIQSSSSFIKLLVLVVNRYDTANHDNITQRLSALKHDGYKVIILDLGKSISDSDRNDLFALGTEVYTVPNAGSLNFYSSRIASELNTFFGSALPNQNGFRSMQVVDNGWVVSDFDIAKHGYSFQNLKHSAFGKDGGVCSGMSLTSIMNFYESLPAIIINGNQPLRIVGNTTLGSGTELYRFPNTQFAPFLKLTNCFANPPRNRNDNNQVQRMLSVWHKLANNFLSQGINGSVVDQGAPEDNGFISNGSIKKIMELIDAGLPVFIMAGRFDDGGESGHSVVAVAYQLSNSNNKLTIRIYDNNRPGNSTNTIVLNRNTGTGLWNYNWADYVWGDSTVASFGGLLGIGVTNVQSYYFGYIDTVDFFSSFYSGGSSIISQTWQGNNLILNNYTSDTNHEIFLNSVSKSSGVTVANNVIRNATGSNVVIYAVETVLNNNWLPDIYNSVNRVANNRTIKDLSSNAWYYQAVMKAINNGIIEGYPDKTFKPTNKMSRAEFMTILIKSIGIKKDPGVSGQHWAENYMAYARTQGWLDASINNATAYNATLTRSEACQLLWNVLSSNTAQPYSDIHLVYLSPIGQASGRYAEFENGTAFSDQSGIDSKYHDAIQQLYLQEKINGYKEGNKILFKPNLELDRATCSWMLMNCLK